MKNMYPGCPESTDENKDARNIPGIGQEHLFRSVQQREQGDKRRIVFERHAQLPRRRTQVRLHLSLREVVEPGDLRVAHILKPVGDEDLARALRHTGELPPDDFADLRHEDRARHVCLQRGDMLTHQTLFDGLDRSVCLRMVDLAAEPVQAPVLHRRKHVGRDVFDHRAAAVFPVRDEAVAYKVLRNHAILHIPQRYRDERRSVFRIELLERGTPFDDRASRGHEVSSRCFQK